MNFSAEKILSQDFTPEQIQAMLIDTRQQIEEEEESAESNKCF